MSCMRKHPKTLRDITFMACFSSKPSSPARVLWEGTAWGHAHTTAHTLCSVVELLTQKWCFYSQPGHLDPVFRAEVQPPPPVCPVLIIWKPLLKYLHLEKCQWDTQVSAAQLPLQKEKKKKKLKLSFWFLYKRKTGKITFPQGAYAAVPGARTQLLWGFWLSAAFQY